MINLYPASYSKGKQVELSALAIKSYPLQKPNTLEAMDGKVYEFTLYSDGRPPVGTLHEIHEFVNKTAPNDEYHIICSNGQVIVKYVEGSFIVKRATVIRNPTPVPKN